MGRAPRPPPRSPAHTPPTPPYPQTRRPVSGTAEPARWTPFHRPPLRQMRDVVRYIRTTFAEFPPGLPLCQEGRPGEEVEQQGVDGVRRIERDPVGHVLHPLIAPRPRDVPRRTGHALLDQCDVAGTPHAHGRYGHRRKLGCGVTRVSGPRIAR